MLEFTKPGLSTTVQDLGRPGYYHLGIPQGGAMDQFSAAIGNRLVGNSRAEAVLECTYTGPTFTTDEAVAFAVTGAPVPVTVNSKRQENWTRIDLEPGDSVSFGVIQGGARFYLAFAGGIDVPLALGSRSTYAIGALGGYEGRPLAAGDRLTLGRPVDHPPRERSLPQRYRPAFSRTQEVRIVLGLYDHLMTPQGKHNLLEGEWTLTPVADRMGLRYSGPGVPWREREQPFGAGSDPSNIVDAGYPVGSIQVPGGAQPIILHRDAASGGGYAMAGTVITADMDLVARAAPGTQTHFKAVSMEDALSARAERAALLVEAEEALIG